MGATLEVTTNEKLKELIDDIEAKLDNGTYGLSALNIDLDFIISLLGTPAGASLAADLLDIENKLDNPTYGLAALNTDLDALLADIGNASASALGSIYGILGNPSASLATTILDGIDARANNATLNGILNFPDTAGYTLYDSLIGNVNEVNRVAGKTQILEVSVTSAANAGADTTLATVTTEPCVIEKVILRADATQTDDLTSCPIFGAAGKVITFISAVDAIQANLDATSKQLAPDIQAGVYLDTDETIVMEHHGTGATALNLTVIIVYIAVANGGYLV